MTLGGTLVFPEGPGPHPAVVRIHGAGPADRNNFIDEVYASRGIAFLTYDKRGVGGSTGDWQKAGVEDLAGDAAAGVALLAGRRDIDPKRIGVAGGSEGGWVAAAVTGRIADLAFALMIAGPALSFLDEVLNEVDYGLRQQGVAEPELGRALAFERRKLELIRSGAVFTDAGWAALETAADSVRSATWFQAVQPWPRGFWRYEKYRQMTQFDPTGYWERYRGPLLAVYGGKDGNAPAPRNVEALRRALAKAGNARHEIALLPNADHEGLDPITADGETVRFAPGFLGRPLQWILEQVGTARPR